MKKLIFLFLASTLFYCNAFSQTKANLDKLPEKERNEYLIKLAKEAVMKHGPGYYRNVKPPIIKRQTVTMDRSDFTQNKKSSINRYVIVDKKIALIPSRLEDANQGRSFYTIEYLYDEIEESFY